MLLNEKGKYACIYLGNVDVVWVNIFTGDKFMLKLCILSSKLFSSSGGRDLKH